MAAEYSKRPFVFFAWSFTSKKRCELDSPFHCVNLQTPFIKINIEQ